MTYKLTPLNIYSEIKSKPMRCIKYNWSGGNLKDGISFEIYCKRCEWRIDEECGYREYKTEISKGVYGDDYYIQFCCAECGELIQLVNGISYIFHHNLVSELHECKHCGTPHRYIRKHDGEDLMYTFAIPIKKVTHD